MSSNDSAEDAAEKEASTQKRIAYLVKHNIDVPEGFDFEKWVASVEKQVGEFAEVCMEEWPFRFELVRRCPEVSEEDFLKNVQLAMLVPAWSYPLFINEHIEVVAVPQCCDGQNCGAETRVFQVQLSGEYDGCTKWLQKVKDEMAEFAALGVKDGSSALVVCKMRYLPF